MTERKNADSAVWSLVLGILAVCGLGPLTGIPAIICGHVARKKIHESRGAFAGDGLAVAGLVTGYIATAMTVLILVFSVTLMGLFSNTIRGKMGEAVMELGGDTAAKDAALNRSSQEYSRGLDYEDAESTGGAAEAARRALERSSKDYLQSLNREGPAE